MGFVWASIAGNLYGKPHGSPAPFPNPDHVHQGTAHTLVFDPQMQKKLGAPFAFIAGSHADSSKPQIPHPSLTSTSLHILDLEEEYTDSQTTAKSPDPPDKHVASFFIHLALCNTVIPGQSDDGTIVYQASSPDEEALVQGAALMGYQLISRSSDRIVISCHGQQYEYEVLAVLEFNSDRKRMSVIIKDKSNGKIRLLCKGADTMIMTRIMMNESIVPQVKKHLEEASLVGYRTLCIAEKELSQEGYEQWSQIYHQATINTSDRVSEGAHYHHLFILHWVHPPLSWPLDRVPPPCLDLLLCLIPHLCSLPWLVILPCMMLRLNLHIHWL